MIGISNETADSLGAEHRQHFTLNPPAVTSKTDAGYGFLKNFNVVIMLTTGISNGF
jgi:hypothetical protein